jgi:chromosome segregation ATPase
MNPNLDGNSVAVSSQPSPADEAFRLALQAAESDLANLRAASASRIAALEAEVEDKDKRLQGYANDLGTLQTRYELRTAEYRNVCGEKQDLIADVSVARRRSESLASENTKLKETVHQRQEELRQCRQRLAESAIPGIAQVEQLEAKNRSLDQETESLRKKVKSLEEVFEFTRKEYQGASTAAAENASRMAELERENQGLRKKAAGEAAKLRQINDSQEREMYLQQVSRMKVELDELQDLLRRKERGRGMTTRTGSVAPKSPRPGSPVGSRAGSRAAPSRPGSPTRSFLGVRKGRGLLD